MLFLKEKCFSTTALAKIVHLETVDEILTVLGECYVRPDRYVDEVLGPVRKMRSLDEYDAIGLESYYATILATCAEARELGQYESLANPVVSGVMIDKLPLSELRDYDSYRMEGQGRRFVSELHGFEEFVKGRLPGVRRLADRQRSRGSAHKEKGYAKEKGQGSNDNANKQFDHGRDRKGGKEMYQVISGAVTAKPAAGQSKVSPKGNSQRPPAASGNAGPSSNDPVQVSNVRDSQAPPLSVIIQVVLTKVHTISRAVQLSAQSRWLKGVSGWRKSVSVGFV